VIKTDHTIAIRLELASRDTSIVVENWHIGASQGTPFALDVWIFAVKVVD